MPVSFSTGPRALSVLGAVLALALAAPSRADTAPQTIGDEPVVQIETGGQHSCALVQSGRVWCWGRGYYGALGNDSLDNSPIPVPVHGLTGAVQIAVGGYHSCALRSTGRVFCWGSNSHGQIGDGTVSDDSRSNDRLTPVRVVGLTGVTAITAGTQHSCALRDTGRAFCWGLNSSGQLGDGTTTQRPTPVRVAGPWSTGIVQIAAGTAHGCLLNQAGGVACWGYNGYGALGDGTSIDRRTPEPVLNLGRVTQIATGTGHSCALRDTGRVFCWGVNSSGELGDGTLVDHRRLPVRVVNLTAVTQIGTGLRTSCAVRASGRVFCWGSNASGALGNGSPSAYPTTVPVRVVGLVNATQVAPGGEPGGGYRYPFTCGLRSDGAAFCWGFGYHGQLGNGAIYDRWTARRVRN